MKARAFVGVAAGIALLLVLTAAVLFLRDDEEPREADMEGLLTYSDLSSTHVEEAVDYEQSPAVGGEHLGDWLDCGVFDEPVPDELAVHDLEHGAVWIAYDAEALDDAGVAALAEALPDNGIMSPYLGLDRPVVVSSWERQVRLDSTDDPRLPEFVEAYENNPIAPESGLVTCSGGVDAAGAARVAEQIGR